MDLDKIDAGRFARRSGIVGVRGTSSRKRGDSEIVSKTLQTGCELNYAKSICVPDGIVLSWRVMTVSYCQSPTYEHGRDLAPPSVLSVYFAHRFCSKTYEMNPDRIAL